MRDSRSEGSTGAPNSNATSLGLDVQAARGPALPRARHRRTLRVYGAGTQRQRLRVPLSTPMQSLGANHSAPAGPNRAATRPKLT